MLVALVCGPSALVLDHPTIPDPPDVPKISMHGLGEGLSWCGLGGANTGSEYVAIQGKKITNIDQNTV